MVTFLKSKLSLLRAELSTYSPRERGFILFAMLCGFFITCEYSLIRPVSNSLFLHAFSVKFIPYAWIATVPVSFLMVSLYNRLIPKWGSKKLFVTLIGLVMVVNLFFALFAKTIHSLPFFFYVWKEVYVMLMFQLLWSVIHSNVQLKKARYLYGLFFGIGGLGSMLGSSVPSFFAVSYGSESLIFLSLPVYLLLLTCYLKMSQHSLVDAPTKTDNSAGGFRHGLKLIQGSRFLTFILLIVLFMQVLSAIVDFQFNDFLERTLPDTDIRTEFSARVMGVIHTLTVLLQFIGSYAMIRYVGFKRSHYVIPSVLTLSACLFAAIPIFPVIIFGFVTIKALDFSLFGVIREMLYIPLKSDEKFRAKSIIDVFAHRSAKALASIMILVVQVSILDTSRVLTYLGISIALLWIGSVAYGMKEYDQVVKG
ncbi:MAG: ADP,ATP carrier protein 1 [Chlamydiae bacterium]|nr:ADP,ATP carrier protein 1 [Chlamydiota bacterium]